MKAVRITEWEKTVNVLKPGGRFVCMNSRLPEDTGKDRGIVSKGTYTQATVEDLTKLAEAIDAGKAKVFVQRTFPINETQMALSYQPEDGAPGKVVITVD